MWQWFDRDHDVIVNILGRPNCYRDDGEDNDNRLNICHYGVGQMPNVCWES